MKERMKGEREGEREREREGEEEERMKGGRERGGKNERRERSNIVILLHTFCTISLFFWFSNFLCLLSSAFFFCS